ncbi:MAG TPA: 5-formyltetrahydrofolate cyclo-ligase, partial [Gammaproteobacteria bacterium]|nr:5-formyltetrahydrofolate cyclo-ligase [Gammaproteobacteria bacterium]
RLGMGGGYCDRSFEFLRRRQCWRKPYLVGVAHDFQETDKLQSDAWDIPLDAIVTPTRLIKPRSCKCYVKS